jgi:ABC-type phosphate transport system substrate-binding protein
MRLNATKLGAAATAAVALGGLAALPGTAGAAFDSSHDTTCENARSITGRGASFQRSLHVGFGASIVVNDIFPAQRQGFGYDLPACGQFKLPADLGTETIRYNPAGSGAGRAAFGATRTADQRHTDGTGVAIAPENFGGVDEAPTDTELANANEGHVDDSVYNDDARLRTIPIAQSSIAVDVRIPDGCTVAQGTTTSTRGMSRATVEGAFAANSSFDTWGEILRGITGTVTGTATACRDQRFVRVVRQDSSGTTFQFKRYLAAVNGATGWAALGNAAWPNDAGATATVRSASRGAGAQLDTLSAQNVTGGIGYADLATSRTTNREYGWGSSAADSLDRRFWVYVGRAADDVLRGPALNNNQSATVAQKGANCSGVTYADSSTGVLPASTLVSWYNVDAVLTANDYGICALTYGLAWSTPQPVNAGINRSNASTTTPLTQGQQRATKDYFVYITSSSTGLGQDKLNGLDYGRLPSAVQFVAATGAGGLDW